MRRKPYFETRNPRVGPVGPGVAVPPMTTLTIEINHATGLQTMKMGGTPLSWILVSSVLSNQLSSVISEMVKQSMGLINPNGKPLAIPVEEPKDTTEKPIHVEVTP